MAQSAKQITRKIARLRAQIETNKKMIPVLEAERDAIAAKLLLKSGIIERVKWTFHASSPYVHIWKSQRTPSVMCELDPSCDGEFFDAWKEAKGAEAEFMESMTLWGAPRKRIHRVLLRVGSWGGCHIICNSVPGFIKFTERYPMKGVMDADIKALVEEAHRGAA